MTTKHTVIGGGLAGLTAAVQLAKQGAQVRLLEAHSELGGRARTTEVEGFALNMGPHAMYLDGVMARALGEWGILPGGGSPMLADGAHMVADGKKYGFVRDLKSLATAGFLGILDKVEAGQALGKLTGNAEAARGLTFAEWLDRETKRPAVRSFVEAVVRLSTYCNAPGEQSAEAVIEQLAMGNRKGVRYVAGGWQAIIANLRQHAGQVGVEFVNRAGEAEDVGPGTVLAVSPAEVERLTGKVLPGMTPIRMACLDVALEGLPEGAAIFGLGLDEPLYYSVHSQWTEVAPPGGAVVHLGKYMGAAAADAAADRAQLERFADLLMPGWREVTVKARFLPEMVVAHAHFSVDGRPDVDALGIKGVRIAGDWVGPEGMLADAAVASGLRAAGSLLARKNAA